MVLLKMMWRLGKSRPALTGALRGEVASDEEREQMLAAIRGIEGVTRVEDLTH